LIKLNPAPRRGRDRSGGLVPPRRASRVQERGAGAPRPCARFSTAQSGSSSDCSTISKNGDGIDGSRLWLRVRGWLPARGPGVLSDRGRERPIRDRTGRSGIAIEITPALSGRRVGVGVWRFSGGGARRSFDVGRPRAVRVLVGGARPRAGGWVWRRKSLGPRWVGPQCWSMSRSQRLERAVSVAVACERRCRPYRSRWPCRLPSQLR